MNIAARGDPSRRSLEWLLGFGASPVLRSTSPAGYVPISHRALVSAMIGRSDMLKSAPPPERRRAAAEIVDAARLGQRLAEDRKHVAMFGRPFSARVRRAAEKQTRIRLLIRLDIGIRALERRTRHGD